MINTVLWGGMEEIIKNCTVIKRPGGASKGKRGGSWELKGLKRGVKKKRCSQKGLKWGLSSSLGAGLVA